MAHDAKGSHAVAWLLDTLSPAGMAPEINPDILGWIKAYNVVPPNVMFVGEQKPQ